MDVEEFLYQAIVQVQRGVTRAQKELNPDPNVNGVVNPRFADEAIEKMARQIMEFDIAITSTEQSGSGASGGLKVVGIHIGADGNSSQVSQQVSRVKFSVPFIPPVTEVKSDGDGVAEVPEAQPGSG